MEDFINLKQQIDSLQRRVNEVLANQNIVIQKTSQLLNDGEGNNSPFAKVSDIPTYLLEQSDSNDNLYVFKLNGVIVSSIDLAPYIDGASAIQGATIDANGLATFTRQDSSTFTLDFSTFLGDTVTKSQQDTVYYVASFGNNATGSANDITKPFVSIDAVLALYPNTKYLHKNVRIELLDSTIPYEINTAVPLFSSLTIGSKYAVTISLTNSGQTNFFKLFTTGETLDFYLMFDIPNGKIKCDKAGFNSVSFSCAEVNVILNCKEIFWKSNNTMFNTSTVNFIGSSMTFTLGNMLLSNTCVMLNDTLDVQNLTITNNTRLFNTKGKTISIAQINISNTINTGVFYEESVEIGDIVSTNTSYSFTFGSYGAYLNIKFEGTVSNVPIYVAGPMNSDTYVTGAINSVPHFGYIANTATINGVVEDLFVREIGSIPSPLFTINGGNHRVKDCLFYTTFNSAFSLTSVNTDLEIFDIKVITTDNEGSTLITGGSTTQKPTVQYSGITHNFTSLFSHNINGETFTVKRLAKDSVSTVVNEGYFYINLPTGSGTHHSGGVGIEAAGNYTGYQNYGTTPLPVVMQGDIIDVKITPFAEWRSVGLLDPQTGSTDFYTITFKNYAKYLENFVDVTLVGLPSAAGVISYVTPLGRNKIILSLLETGGGIQSFGVHLRMHELNN